MFFISVRARIILQNAFPIQEFAIGLVISKHEAITSEDKASIYRKHAGDVYFRLQDNWLIDNKEDQPFDQVIQSKPTIPVLYWSGTMTSFPEGKLAATDIKELIMNY